MGNSVIENWSLKIENLAKNMEEEYLREFIKQNHNDFDDDIDSFDEDEDEEKNPDDEEAEEDDEDEITVEEE